MPTLIDARVVALEFADLYRRVPITRPAKPPARAPGIHQSDILAFIARKIGVLKPGEKLEEEMPWRMALGVMWEEFWFSMLAGTEWQPGELVEDGIAVNCDGITAGETCVRCGGTGREAIHPIGNITDIACEVCDGFGSYTLVEETKCTEKKLRTPEAFLEEWMWMHQGRAYCYCYGVQTVRWTVMFYRGDWAGSGPVCMQYLVKFTEKEIRQTWNMLCKNKNEAEAALIQEAEDLLFNTKTEKSGGPA